MNRRSFFKFLPIAPVALVAEGAKAVGIDDQPTNNDINVSLIGSKPNKTSSTSIFGNMPIADPSRAVSMGVGRDGNLWIKSKGGEWAKVLTE